MNTDKGKRRIASRCDTACSKFPRLAHAFLIALLAFTILPMHPAYAQQTPPVYTFPECENVEEEILLGELNRITRSVFEEGQSNLNISEIVDRNWEELDMDSVVDAAVDEAAENVLKSEGLWERIKSGWHSPTAEEFTKKVVAGAFDSHQFHRSVSQLSQAIVDDLAVEFRIITAITASSSLLCLQEFIGASFSKTMAMALEENVQKWLDEISFDPDTEPEFFDLLRNRGLGGIGIGTIVGTQIGKVLAKQLSQTIVGKIVSRIVGKAAGSLIPVVGWVIGGALIVWDLIQLQKGSVPQIQEALKGQDVKNEIRAQIAVVVENELREALPILSESVTLDIYNQWTRFLKDFEHVLRLSEKNENFRTIVDGVTADQVDKLSELVAIGTEALGTEWIDSIIETGEFERILALPRASFEILSDTADPELVLAWSDLAGEGIVSVVKTELYKVTSPSEIGDRGTLGKVLALEDSLAIQVLMKFKLEERRVLLRLRTGQTKWLLSELSEEDLTWLLEYSSELQGQATEILVDFVIRDRVLISLLQGSGDLRARFPAALNLAVTNSMFQQVLNGTTAGQVDKLSELVAVASGALEPEEIASLIDSGLFEEILALPNNSFDILRVTGNPALVLDWAELAGEALFEVVETGLYLVAAPNEFLGRADLERVLAIENPVAIQRLMNLEQNERGALLKLSPEEARATLLSDLSKEELSWLAGYLPDLPALAQQLLAYYVVQKQDLIPRLRDSEELQEKFPRVLDLALIVPLFRNILDTKSPKDLGKLSELVVVAEQALDPKQLTEFVASGQFEQVFSFPKAAFVILKSSKDPALVIAWADLAGADIIRVVSTELHKIASPDQLMNREELRKALEIQDPEALKWILQLNQGDRSFLLTSQAVANVLWLFSLKSDLTDDTTVLLARFINLNPALMSELDIEKIGQSFMLSQNPEAVLTFVSARTVEPETLLPTITMFTSASEIISGDLPTVLYLHYYLTQWLILLTALLVLTALSISGWRLFRRRQLPEIWDRIRRTRGGSP